MEMEESLNRPILNNIYGENSGTGIENMKSETLFACRVCTKEIEASEVLIDTLCRLEHSDHNDNDKIIKYVCRLCEDIADNKSGITNHVLNHIKQRDNHYCGMCQQWLNKLEEGFTEEFCHSNADSIRDTRKELEKGQIIEVPNLLPYPITTKSRRFSDRIFNFIYKKIRRKTHRSHLMKTATTKTWRTCQLCGVTTAIKKLKNGKVYCNYCIKYEEEKNITWRLKYFYTIFKTRHINLNMKVKNHQLKKGTFVAKRICKLCGVAIVDINPLISVLLEEKPKKSPMNFTNITLHQCLVCGFRTQAFYPAIKHITAHLNSHEIYYCARCQIAINEISIEDIPDSSITDVLAPTNTPALIGRTNLVGVKSSLNDVTIVPGCGKCGKIFDYITPLIHKIVEFRVQILGTMEREVKKLCCYYCRLCTKNNANKYAIEKHALDHIMKGDVLCKHCRVKREMEAKVEEYNQEDAKMYESFLLTLESNDFEGDEDLLEAMKSCDWNFISI